MHGHTHYPEHGDSVHSNGQNSSSTTSREGALKYSEDFQDQKGEEGTKFLLYGWPLGVVMTGNVLV